MNARATNVFVCCDVPGCGWKKRIAFLRIPRYHHVACPKCGKGEIVSDMDMVIFELSNATIKVSNIIDPKGKLPRRSMHIDTAPLRVGQPENPK